MGIAALENLTKLGSPATQKLATSLIQTWEIFSESIDNVPVIKSIYEGSLTATEYQKLLRNLRAQVIDGANWMTRAASSFDAKSSPIAAMIRDIVINHASEEKGDYKMLENDFQAAGGSMPEIMSAQQNIATYALTSFMMNEASKPNPFHVLGAIFIIEGMGTIKAGHIAKAIVKCDGIPAKSVSFLEYHNKNDDQHYATFAKFISLPGIAESYGDAIVKLAKTVALLYKLQFENLDNT